MRSTDWGRTPSLVSAHTCISCAADRGAVGGGPGAVLPGPTLAPTCCLLAAHAAGLAHLWVFLLGGAFLLGGGPVAASRAPPGACGTQARQLWLQGIGQRYVEGTGLL